MATYGEKQYGSTIFHVDESTEVKKITDKMVVPDYVERITYNGELTASDMFLLRGVQLFRIATARMVAEWLIYYRNRTGEGTEELPLILPDRETWNGVDDWVLPNNYVKTIESRLEKMAKRNIIFHLCYTSSRPRVRGAEGTARQDRKHDINFFVANPYTFRLVSARFGGTERYAGYYYMWRMDRTMESLHACSVAIRAFMMTPDAKLSRETGVIYGATKENYVPEILVERELNGICWYIMCECFCFDFNKTEITYSEKAETNHEKVNRMKNLLRHENYILQKYETVDKRYRFLVSTDSWRGLGLLLSMLEEHIELFSGRVVVVTDAGLMDNHYSLKRAGMLVVAKEKENGTKTAALRGITKKELLNNTWIHA